MNYYSNPYQHSRDQSMLNDTMNGSFHNQSNKSRNGNKTISYATAGANNHRPGTQNANGRQPQRMIPPKHTKDINSNQLPNQ